MAQNSEHSIVDIPTESDLNVGYPSPGCTFGTNIGINISALLRVACSVLSKQFPPQICLWKSGSFNKVFLITFSDGSEVIVRAPFPKYAHKLRTSSEVATMSFAREHLKDIPVPQVFAWQPDNNNEVGVPYMILEKLPGVPLTESQWFKLSREKQRPILEALACFHAQLARPVPFQKIGNIFFAPPGSPTKYTTGALLPSPRWASVDIEPPLPIEPPSADLRELWFAITRHEFENAYGRWSRNLDAVIIEEEDLVEGPAKTTADFADVYRDLSAIISTHHVPAEFTSLCLWHGDIALRNVLFDLDSGTITGVLDWEDTAVLPLILTAQYPYELVDTGGWHLCPDDWPALGPPDKWGIGGRAQAEENVDVTWARWYYSAHLAWKDARMSSSFWKEAALPLKIHEVIVRGWDTWLHRQKWIHDMAGKIAASQTHSLPIAAD